MRFPLAILVTLLFSYALGFYLAIPANPEVQFWNSLAEKRDTQISTLRRERINAPIILFSGGSSTAFSIKPEIIEQSTGIPCFNLGLPVGSGAKYILHHALERATKGDYLVICLEHGVLITYKEDSKPSKLSYAFAIESGNPHDAVGGRTFDHSLTLNDHLNFSRPGATLLPTLIARKIIDKPYRYGSRDIRYHGRVETNVRDESMQFTTPTGVTQLTNDSRLLMKKFKAEADKKGVHVAYSLPWLYTNQATTKESRSENQALLREISTIMPVIEDGYSGAAMEKNWFADTALHLNDDGATIRSKALVKPLNNWIIEAVNRE